MINIDSKNTEVLEIRKDRQQIYIYNALNFNRGTDDLKDELIDTYIDEIIKIIEERIEIKYKNIYFNIQNEEIIIRNINNIKTKRYKEIVHLIKYEINQYIPLDLQNYIIRYKKIINFQGKEMIQGILFPEKFVYMCREISKKLKIKKRYLHINYDILQKLIDLKFINLGNEEKYVLIENRKENMILNILFKDKIIESYVIDKCSNQKSFQTYLSEKNIYYFGLSDNFIENLKVEKIPIKSKLSLYNSEKEDVTHEYLQVIGMII